MQLRTYQEEITTELESEPRILVISPTGSGKTIMLAHAAKQLSAAGRDVLVATSLSSVNDAIQQVSPDVVLATDDASASAAIRRFLSLSETGESRGVMLVNHAVLSACDSGSVGSNVVIIIDEAHHAGEKTKLGQFLRSLNPDVQVKMLTATGSRSDDDAVLLPGMKLFQRTLAQHMAEGFAPQGIQTEVHGYAVMHKVSDDSFYGEEIQDRELASLVGKMCNLWIRKGKPKLVIRVAQVPGGAEYRVNAVIKRFREEGARVLNGYGQDATVFRETLKEESSRLFAESLVDVVVGCGRVHEAMDWKHCVAYYNIGIPRSPQVAIQGLGRAMRLKDSTCPAKWRNESSIAFFVPTTRRGLESIGADHARRILVLCAYLEATADVKLWQALQKSRKSQYVPSSKRPHGGNPKNFDPLGIAKLRVELELAYSQLLEEGQEEITDGQLYSQLLLNGLTPENASHAVEISHIQSIASRLDGLVSSFLQDANVHNQAGGGRTTHGLLLRSSLIKKYGAILMSEFSREDQQRLSGISSMSRAIANYRAQASVLPSA